MNFLKFAISVVVATALMTALNMKIGVVPPLGRFLDPVGGFWANAEDQPEVRPDMQIPGLQQPVNVLYDDMLVPHIFAGNEDDLYRAVGYVQARHRLWQMDFQVRAAGGALSEIVGPTALDYDRGQRRKGMVFGAKNFTDHLDQKSKKILETYIAGINAYISQLKPADYPLEYKLLNYTPTPWTLLKSGLLYKYMSDMLNASEKDMENTNFRDIYGKDMLDLIYPDVDNYADPVVNRPNDWQFEPVKKNTPYQAQALAMVNPLPGPNPNNGSNNWAVAPAKSASGRAILCNDMHLNLYLPSLWFYMQCHTDSMNVFGHTLPGLPFVITGFTDSIAWGMTNAQRDLVDWYKIEYEDSRRERYLLDGKYVPVEKKIEEIKIRDEQPYYDTVSYTVFGPVTYDQTYRASAAKNGYARRWIDHDPSTSFRMFYLIDKAKNFDDYMKALDYFDSPAQNVVFADVQGDIAHRVQGKYPVNDIEEGKFIKDGTHAANNWQKFIPNGHNAFWKNPERGFVASANQHPADSTYPYYITARSYESYRNRRINNVLRSKNNLTIADMKALQYDNYSLMAAESLPFMLDKLKGVDLSAREIDIAEKLKKWDYYYAATSDEAVYYDLWYKILFKSIWDEIADSQSKHVPLKYPTKASTIRLMKEHPTLDFFDNKSTKIHETAPDLIRDAFKEMALKAEKLSVDKPLSWGRYKATYIGHQARIKALSINNIITGGGGDGIVNATDTNNGPSERIIIDLDPAGVKAWGHYPGGQSGNPGSRYYANMVTAWATGQYYELLFLHSYDPEHSRIIYRQTLKSK